MKTFGVLLAVYAALTLVAGVALTAFTAAALSNAGTSVGALGFLLGGWRILHSDDNNNAALESVVMEQSIQDHYPSQQPPMARQRIHLKPPGGGVLFFSGAVWMVLMQAIHFYLRSAH